MQLKYGNKHVKKKKCRKKKKRTIIKKVPIKDTCITVILPCVNYSDYLIETLPTIKNIFDDIYVITTYQDNNTQELCRKTRTKCIVRTPTQPTFKRGIYINTGLKCVPKKGWFLITDADIAFPPEAKQIYEHQLDKKCLYGVFRHRCTKYSQWLKYKMTGKITKWKVMRRNAQVGMGFFQLFHTNHFIRRGRNLNYRPFSVNPKTHKGSDYYFARKFRCKKRLRFFDVIHLENGRYGQNHHGRFSNIFQNSD